MIRPSLKLSGFRLAMLIGCIVCFSFALRLFQLEENPPGFFCDEADIGLSAYRILQDFPGVEPFKAVIPGVNGGRNPLPVYLTMIPVHMFGLSVFSVRLTSALLGTGSTLLIYAVTAPFLSRRFRLITMLIYSITPWAFMFDRIGWEQSAWICLFLAAYACWMRGATTCYSILMGLSLYTYHPSWLITPVFFILTLLMGNRINKRLHRKEMGKNLVIFLFVSLPLALAVFDSSATVRVRMVFESDTPRNLVTVFRWYANHFRFDFLFTHGDIVFHPIIRHAVPGMGVLSWYQFPLIAAGLYRVIRRFNRFDISILLLVFLFALPDALAGSTLANRSALGVIPGVMLSGIGAYQWAVWIGRFKHLPVRIGIAGLACGMMILSFWYLCRQYFLIYPQIGFRYWGWQAGPQEVVQYFLDHQGEYDELIARFEANGSEVFIPFFSRDFKDGCRNCTEGSLSDWDCRKRQLFALPVHQDPGGFRSVWNLKEVIRSISGQPVYVLYESIPGCLGVQNPGTDHR